MRGDRGKKGETKRDEREAEEKERGERKRERVGGGYNQDQSTSAEWALAPSCDLWPASAPKAEILLTKASCSTWITLVFKHQQALQIATGDIADTRETCEGQARAGHILIEVTSSRRRRRRRRDIRGGGEITAGQDGSEGDGLGQKWAGRGENVQCVSRTGKLIGALLFPGHSQQSSHKARWTEGGTSHQGHSIKEKILPFFPAVFFVQPLH